MPSSVLILTRAGRTEAAALIADLLARFPAHRSWTAALECELAVLDANAAPR